MLDKLPQPCVLCAFGEDARAVDCLRSALNLAKRMQAGVWFEQEGVAYTVQPWMSVDQVVTMADSALGASIREHLTHG